MWQESSSSLGRGSGWFCDEKEPHGHFLYQAVEPAFPSSAFQLLLGRSLLFKVLATLPFVICIFYLFLPPSSLPSPFSALTKDFLDNAIFQVSETEREEPNKCDLKQREGGHLGQGSKAFERRDPSKFQ